MNKTKLSKFPEDMVRLLSKTQVRVMSDFLAQAMSIIGNIFPLFIRKQLSINNSNAKENP